MKTNKQLKKSEIIRKGKKKHKRSKNKKDLRTTKPTSDEPKTS